MNNNYRIKKIEDLKDSQIMFDKNPPEFGYIIIMVIAIFCALTVLWSIHTPKKYTIQAQGVVTDENANYVMSAYTGVISDCNLEEGKIVEEGEQLFVVKSADYDSQAEQLELNKRAYEERIEKYRLLVKSIKDDINYFDDSNPEDELYYSIFETYKSQVKQSRVDTSAYATYGYTEEQIESELKKEEGKVSQLYYDAIKNAESAISEAELQIEGINSQLAAIGLGKGALAIKASASGTIHMMTNYKNGMVIQSAQTVASITPKNSKSVIEAYVSTSDMARIHEGDKVQIVVDGLSQNIYGTISGRVKQIDSNVTVQQTDDGQTNQVFKIIISMDSDYVISQSGDKVDLQNGMTTVSRITYDKQTYFDYALEKMGIKVRG